MIPYEALNAWGEAWASAMGRALFDASALLLVVLAVWLPLRRRISAQLAHGLFCLVLLRLTVPQGLPWLPAPSVRHSIERAAAWAWPAAGEPEAVATSPGPGPGITAPAFQLPTTGDLAVTPADAPARFESPAPETPRAVRVPPRRLTPRAWLMVGWAAVALTLLARFGRAVLATRAMIREALPIDPRWLPVDVDALKRSVGVRRQVRWAVSPRLRTPAVGGLFRPTVVIPPDLEDGLTPQQLRWVLLHELAHVRRGDLWVVMAQRAVQAVFFFHPAVHVANWVIDQLREYACDDAALAACQAPRRDCGEGFLTVVERSAEPAPAAAAALGLFESRMLIRRRLVRILDTQRRVHSRLSTRASLGLLFAAALVIAFGRTRDASARPRGPIVPPLASAGAPEPLTYRPGEAWHRETSGGPSASPAARTSVLALAYSADGTTLATAGEGPVIALRDVRSGRVVARLTGHRDAVACLAFSPDGKTLASGGYDKTVRLWGAREGRELAVLTGHTNWVFALAFSPDGNTLASAGHDKSVRLWDVPARAGRDVLGGLAGSVRALAYSPDGATLATGGADRVVTLWDLASRAPRSRLEGHKGTVRALAFAPIGGGPGRRLASAGEDGEVRLWETEPGRAGPIATLAGHPDMAVCLAFSPGGTTLASGGLDATVKLWDPASGRERSTLRGHHDGVSALAFAPGARQLASSGFDGAVRLWEPAPPAFSPAFCLSVVGAARGLGFTRDGRTLFVSGAAGQSRWDAVTGTPLESRPESPRPPAAGTPSDVSLDGRRRVDGTASGALRIVEAATGRPLAEVKGHDGAVTAVAFAADGKTIASSGTDGWIRFHDARTLAPRRAFRDGPSTALRFAGDGLTLASGGRDGEVLLWDVRSGTQRGVLRGHKGAVTEIVFAPDGRSLASTGADGSLKVWNLAVRRVTAREALKPESSCPWAVAYSVDGGTIAVGEGRSDSPGVVTLWDAASRRVRLTLEGHSRGVTAVALSRDGALVAAGSFDQTVRVWDARTGAIRYVIDGLEGVVTDLAFSPDGSSLATAGEQGALTLWDADSGSESARLDGFRGRVQSVAFSPNGRLVVAGGGVFENGPNARGEVRVWDVATRRRLTGFEGHTRGVAAVAFTPDGSALASGGLDESLRVWDVASGRPRLTLAALTGCVYSLGYSSDGRTLAWAGRNDGLVALHDATTGAEVARLVGHTNAVRSLAFSPDGSTLVTAGADRSVKLWDAPRGKAD